MVVASSSLDAQGRFFGVGACSTIEANYRGDCWLLLFGCCRCLFVLLSLDRVCGSIIGFFFWKRRQIQDKKGGVNVKICSSYDQEEEDDALIFSARGGGGGGGKTREKGC